jgi:hypothetical protein
MSAKSGVRRNASHRRSSGWSRLLLSAIATVIGIVLVAGVVLAAVVQVDDFSTGWQALLAMIPAGGGTAEDTDVAAATEAMGDERDIYIWASGGPLAAGSLLRVNVEDSTALLKYAADPGVAGIAQIEWDGNTDHLANSIDYDGLGSVDLTDGDANDGFHLEIIYDDLEVDLTLTVYTDDDEWSDATITLPGGIAEESNRLDVFLPFSGFNQGSGASGPADFEHVGAIVLNIDAIAPPAVDVTMDFAGTNSNREYGDLPLDPGYGDTILNANHIPQGLRLGNDCDAESTYNSSTGADGDDTNDFDDEDGVEPTSLPWSAGSNGGAVNVTREGCADLGSCYVNGWIDWNGDGDFDDTVDGASEQIVNNESESTDTTETYTFNTPTSYGAGTYYARFRICEGSTDCDNPDTTDTDVSNGEVEDYRWDTTPTAVTLTRLDATSAPSRPPVRAAAPVLAFLAGGAAVAGALMRRRRAR